MNRRRLLARIAVLLCAAGVVVGCEGGLVGGSCRSGLVVCEGRCVDLTGDDRHCGACGNACEAGAACLAGVCRPPDGRLDGGDGLDGGGAAVPDALADAERADGPTVRDAGTRDASDAGADASAGAGDAAADAADGARDAGADAADGARDAGADARDAGACVPPFDTPDQCGDCFTSCSGSTPLCEPADGGFACVGPCESPLVLCGGECVNTNEDAAHCGGCSRRCPTGLCQAGQCVGAQVGHAVLICMDYQWSFAGSPQTRLLGNSVFLPPRSPVRILAYAEHTPAAIEASVRDTLEWASVALGRTYELTDAPTAATVAEDLNVIDFDVLLVHDQPDAPGGILGPVGEAWEERVQTFARAGGTVVVLASHQGVAEMGALLTNASLLEVAGFVDVTGSQVHVRAPADAVALNVLSPFLALPATCTFDTPAAPTSTTSFVVTDAPPESGEIGEPVVIHRVVLP